MKTHTEDNKLSSETCETNQSNSTSSEMINDQLDTRGEFKEIKNEQRIHHDIENTPFIVTENENKEFQIIMGNQIASDKKFKTLQTAKEYIRNKPWELLITATCVICQKINELNKTKK